MKKSAGVVGVSAMKKSADVDMDSNERIMRLEVQYRYGDDGVLKSGVPRNSMMEKASAMKKSAGVVGASAMKKSADVVGVPEMKRPADADKDSNERVTRLKVHPRFGADLE